MIHRGVTAAATFQEGEPVVVTTAGTVSECANDPANVAGFAATRPTDVDGTARTVGYPITIYGVATNQVFRTKNLTSGGAGATDVTPTLAHVGDLAGFARNGGVWSLDIGAANSLCEITGVLDSRGNNLSNPNLVNGTGSIVLFSFIGVV